jgi:ubiquitin carboxyl-terminal hydrolase 8
MSQKWEKYRNKAYTGLTNLGNTCFLNSCMQALNHTYELHEILDSLKIKSYMKSDIPDTEIMKEWNELRDVIWKNDCVITPKKFVSNIHKIAKIKNRDIFTGWSQNDMPEFLLFIIESFHNSISRPVSIKITGKIENDIDKIAIKCYEMLQNVYSKEYSEIMELFYGMYVSEIRSMDSNITHSIHPEHFFVLDLPIPHMNNNKIELLNCFDKYVDVEILHGDNAWYNEETKQRENVQKHITFWNLPKVLIITLKRFSPDGQHKTDQFVDFPLDNLDLSKYICGYNPSQYNYELYAVCNHIGNTYMGHYTAFVRNASDEWIHYNDQNVTKLENIQTSIVSPMAYCLFYRKKNTSV